MRYSTQIKPISYLKANAAEVLLELNTQPGMSPVSLLPEIAAHEGVTFNELISWMIDQASCDQKLCA